MKERVRAWLRDPRWRLFLLVVCVVLAYLPSLSGGYLRYDDDWMVRDNPFLKEHSWQGLRAIWCDLSLNTRLQLGAEYLPVRDSVVWGVTAIFQTAALAQRLMNLLLYIGSIILALRATRLFWGMSWKSDFAVAVYALHPAHAESVAWIVGTKDVLALFFFWGASYLHAGRSAGEKNTPRVLACCALLVLAQLSKTLFFVSPLLIVLQDVLQGGAARVRSQIRQYVAYAACVSSALLLQYWVALQTTMTESASSVSRAELLLTMGEAWWGYLRVAFAMNDLSIMHDVRGEPALIVLGYASLLLISAFALRSVLRHPRAAGAWGWLWFLIALFPVSQLLARLQNLQQDRYLVLALFGPALLIASAAARSIVKQASAVRMRVVGGFACVWLACSFVLTAQRAHLFADPVRLFEDAAQKAPDSATVYYQLGCILEEEDNGPRAFAAYRRARLLDERGGRFARSATLNLARALAKQGELQQAEQELRRALPLWPDEPKVWGNLAEVVRLQGRAEEARGLYQQLVTRFPDYQLGVQRFRALYQ